MVNNIKEMNNHLSPQMIEHIKDIGNPGPGFGLEQKCGRVELVNRIPTLDPLLIIESPTKIQI
jgi:hypothetical protein